MIKLLSNSKFKDKPTKAQGGQRAMDKFELVVMRLRVGIKQYQLAALLDVPQTTICDLEKGRRHITPEIERRIEKAINEAKNRKTTVSRK